MENSAEKLTVCDPCMGTGYSDRVWRGNTIPSLSPFCTVCGGRGWSTPSAQSLAPFSAAAPPPPAEGPALGVEKARRLLRSALLEARFTGWEDRDCGDEWDAVKAGKEASDEAERLSAILAAMERAGE